MALASTPEGVSPDVLVMRSELLAPESVVSATPGAAGAVASTVMAPCIAGIAAGVAGDVGLAHEDATGGVRAFGQRETVAGAGNPVRAAVRAVLPGGSDVDANVTLTVPSFVTPSAPLPP
ncbi:MAG: hypothetical protein KF778_13140 [Rhodocyclaceae bacterium]|nr:hypothetical protein [Rhodocyclaceae bacterium]